MPKTSSHFTPSLIITYILGLACLVFTITKATTSTFTYDEGFTFFYYLPQDFMRIFSFAAPYSANNHILSSLLIKYSQALFGSSELALRIPSLIAHIFYMWITILLLKKINPSILIPGFLLFNANPYLLDFYAIGRGYAPAITLMMCSIYCWVKYRESEEKRWYIASIALAATGAFSHFSLLLFVASLLLLHNYAALLSRKLNATSPKEFIVSALKWNKANFIFLGVLLAVFYEPLRRSIQYGLLYHGGDNGFWPDSILSLLQYSLFEASYAGWLLVPLSWFLLALLFISTVILITHIRFSINQIEKSRNWRSDFTLLFLFIIVISSLLNWLAGTFYPIDRGALFLYPLLILITVTLLDKLSRVPGLRKATWVLAMVAGLACMFHTINTQNLHTFIHWKNHFDTPEMMLDLQAHSSGFTDDNPMHLGVDWIYYPVVNYHIIADELDWVDTVFTKGIMGSEDMIYVSKENVLKYEKLGYQVVKNYANTQTSLMQGISVDSLD